MFNRGLHGPVEVCWDMLRSAGVFWGLLFSAVACRVLLWSAGVCWGQLRSAEV